MQQNELKKCNEIITHTLHKHTLTNNVIINAIYILFSFSFFWYCTKPYKTAVCTNTHIETRTSPTTSSPSSTEHTKIYNKTTNHIDYFFCSLDLFKCLHFVLFFFTVFYTLSGLFFSFTCDPTTKCQFYQLKYTFLCSESDFFFCVILFLNIKY